MIIIYKCNINQILIVYIDTLIICIRRVCIFNTTSKL